jgi:hypothetical protein
LQQKHSTPPTPGKTYSKKGRNVVVGGARRTYERRGKDALLSAGQKALAVTNVTISRNRGQKFYHRSKQQANTPTGQALVPRISELGIPQSAKLALDAWISAVPTGGVAQWIGIC